MDIFKEPSVSCTIVGLIEEWEKDKWKTDGTVNKVLFSSKYKDLSFVLPDTGHMYYT